MWVRSLGREDPPEKGMATHSSACLGNLMDRRAWWATVHSIAKSWTRLSDLARMHPMSGHVGWAIPKL